MKYRKYLFIPFLIVAVLSLFAIPQPTPALATETVIQVTYNHQPLTRVTDPALMVTDNHTKSLMTEQGIDTDYVELVQDYGRALTTAKKDAKSANPLTKNKPDPTPYARTYQDKVSGKFIMEIQQLPMVNASGVKVNAAWNYSGEIFTAGANQFTASVNGNNTTLTVTNDQPTGIKSGATLKTSPTLYLNGKAVSPKSATPTLLATDPVNENYANNTLVWDYGICKRYLRLIEGSILGRWEFTDNPKGDIRIVYNQSGDFKLKLGQYASDSDTETIPSKIFDSAEYPFTVGDSQTFYPDAHAESTSVDGYVYQSSTNVDWSALIADVGSAFNDSATTTYMGEVAGTTTDKWNILYRAIYLFDTSGLDDSAIISAATLSLRGQGKFSGNAVAYPNMNIYSSNPASNTELAAGDYDSLGSTAFSTAITYANWLTTTTFNDFALNASGLAAITVSGVSKFGTRSPNYDVAASAPTWVSSDSSNLRAWSSEKGAGYKPKLVVTYTVPSAPTITISAATLITGITARLNGNITDTGGENPTVTMYWGDNDGGQVAGDWDNNSAPTSPGQPQGVAAFYLDISSLTSSKTYYFNAKGTNSYGTDWAAASLSFKTLSRIAKINGISLNDFSIIW